MGIAIGMLSILAVIVCLAVELVSCRNIPNYCYADDNDPYIYVGTKTPYHFVHGFIENSSVPDCEPLQIWLLSRHGTRNPSRDEIKDMLNKLPKLRRNITENHEHGRGSLCNKDIENLKAWRLDPDLSVEKAKYLVKQGDVDLNSLATRFKNYFPELLQPEISDITSDKYKFRATSTERTVKSMGAFMTGLFGSDSAVSSIVVPTKQDKLLRLYKNCESWSKEMKSPHVNEEVNAFINGSEFTKLASDVSYRLGFPNNLTKDTIFLMFTACIFEKSWEVNKVSPWCAVFTKEQLQILEYEEDLYTYYHSGHGQKLSSKVGCVLLKDMFDHFSTVEKGDVGSEAHGIFYFTHSVALQTFLTAIGIAKDEEPLKASNFRSMANRKWRVSLLAPFATNFAAILYKCDSSHKVRFYLDEKPLEYEGCEAGLCDWDYVKRKLGSVVSDCNVDFCQNSENSDRI